MEARSSLASRAGFLLPKRKITMATDLLYINLQIQTFPGQSVLPDDTVGPEVNETVTIAINVGDYIGLLKQTIPASSSDVTLSLPGQPYNVATYLSTDTPVEVNVNSQGWQVVASAFLTMAPVTTLHVRNLLITAPNTGTIDAHIRYGAFKL